MNETYSQSKDTIGEKESNNSSANSKVTAENRKCNLRSFERRASSPSKDPTFVFANRQIHPP